jgi:hypothetical protein
VVTFAEARQLVADQYRETWPVCGDTFYVAPDRREDGTHWLVNVGARKAIVDGRDAEFTALGMPFVAVEKATGRIEEWPQLPYLDRVRAMSPVGS